MSIAAGSQMRPGHPATGPVAHPPQDPAGCPTNVLLWPRPPEAHRVVTAATHPPTQRNTMNNRFAKTLLATAAVAAPAVPVAAQASQGADDPAGHVRQESQAVVAPTSATP